MVVAIWFIKLDLKLNKVSKLNNNLLKQIKKEETGGVEGDW